MLGFSPLADNSIAGFGNTFVSAFVTGVTGTSAVGAVSVDAAIQVTGISATSAVGLVTVTGTALISPTGVVGTSAVGQVFQWDQITPSQTPSWTNIAA